MIAKYKYTRKKSCETKGHSQFARQNQQLVKCEMVSLVHIQIKSILSATNTWIRGYSSPGIKCIGNYFCSSMLWLFNVFFLNNIP